MSHLKRLDAPRTWHIRRKEGMFVVNPLPGSHSTRSALPLQVIMRDILGYVHTARELRRALCAKPVLVDGKEQKEVRAPVGVLDVLFIPQTQENYRLLIDKKGKLSVFPISSSDGKIKLCKVLGKKQVRGGKIQLSLHDGRTVMSDIPVHVGDSIVLSLPEGKITQRVEFAKGAYIYLVRGKHSGSHGVLCDIVGNRITYEDHEKNKIDTLKDYAIVIGKEKPLIEV